MGEKLHENSQEMTNNNYDTSIYARRVYGKIHEVWVKNPPNSSSTTRDGYIRQPCTQLGLTRLADFAKPPLLHPYKMKNKITQWVIVHRYERESNQ